ncbi:MAG: hypothetical protein E3J86_07175 [Candidatus Thorarchaeota archaeon]|nr:MAG: hypothetical protein E3J86_07175 [Candidatus Thorarchaeota archaeon]
MPESEGKTEGPTPFELDIMRSFGWAVVETEKALYQRYLNLSAARSLIPTKVFRTHLREMEAKGYVSSLKLHGKNAYRRLLIGKDVGKEIHPQVPLDEMRLALGSLKAKPKFGKKIRSRVTSEVVEDTDVVGQEIQNALENWMLRDSGRISKGAVHAHVANMMAALQESKEELFEYVRIEVPGLLADLGQVLQVYGPDFLLLTLRVTEHSIRKYKF